MCRQGLYLNAAFGRTQSQAVRHSGPDRNISKAMGWLYSERHLSSPWLPLSLHHELAIWFKPTVMYVLYLNIPSVLWFMTTGIKHLCFVKMEQSIFFVLFMTCTVCSCKLCKSKLHACNLSPNGQKNVNKMLCLICSIDINGAWPGYVLYCFYILTASCRSDKISLF